MLFIFHVVVIVNLNYVNFLDPADIDCRLAIAKRLEAISESVSFHSEFLRYFSDVHSSKIQKEESSDGNVHVAGNNDTVDNRQHVECSDIKGDEADNSSVDTGQHSEDDINDSPSR